MTKSLEDVIEPVNCLWYGDGGMGKTTNLMAMAKLGKVLVVNAESGIKARALREHGIPIANIEIFPDPDDPTEELTFEGLEALWLRIREELNDDPTSWVGTGWDSVTEIQQKMKDIEVVRSVAKANRRGMERDPFVVDQDNWRTINEQCRSLIRRFRDLPCHFGATALSRREQDSDGTVVYMPAVTPGLQNDLIGWFDIICHCSVAIVGEDQEEEYRGLFKPHTKFRGKDRFKILPKWLVDPQFDRVIQYVDGGITIDKDPVMKEAKKRALAASQAADAAVAPAA